MRYVLTNAQMRAADGFTINELKVPSLTLMERAGAALVVPTVEALTALWKEWR